MITNILLIDDNQEFAENFKHDMKAQGWALIHKRSLEGLKDIMPKLNHKLACIILDINCIHTDDQEKENPDFIGDAITYLDQNYPKFPRVILTGDDIEFEGFKRYNKSEDVFLKTPQGKADIINKLNGYVLKSEELKIRRSYPKAFELIDRCPKSFKSEHIQSLFSILKEDSFNTEDKAVIKENLSKLRVLSECLSEVIPLYYYTQPFSIDDYINKLKRNGEKANYGNRSISFIHFLDVYEMKGKVPRPIQNTFKNIYYTASAYASHKKKENIDYPEDYYPSKEIVHGLILCHLGCYEWFNSIID